MVEPIGLLGTGVGIISLGLQVYGELKKYLDNYTGRDEQISKALTRIERLNQSLNVIRDVIPDFESEQRVTNDVVRSCLQSCKDEMLSLQAELQKHQVSPHTDLKGKIREAKKKLQYPFSQKALVELNSRLERILESLFLAIDGLELRCLSSITTEVTGLASESQGHTTALAKLKSDTTALTAACSSANNHLVEVRQGIGPLNRKIDNLEAQASAHFMSLENRIEADQMDTVRRLDALESLMGSLLRQASNSQSPSTSMSIERQLIGNLVSKPSLLKDMHDMADSVHYESHTMVPQEPKYHRFGNTIAVPPENELRYRVTCSCKWRRDVRHFSARWPSIIFTSITMTESKHHLTCPLHQTVRRKRKQQYEITFTGLRKLLNTAVSAGFGLSFGAGGCSISPSFQYFAMVDQRQSPAFQILSLAVHVMFRMGPTCLPTLDEQTANSVLVHAMSQLKAVYAKRMASPSDVNVAGETVVDSLFTTTFTIFRRSRLWSKYFLNTMKALFQLDVLSKNQKATIKILYSEAARWDDSVREIASTVVQAASEFDYQWGIAEVDLLCNRVLVCAADNAMKGTRQFSIDNEFALISSSYTVVSGLDSLCTILLHQDEESLRQALVGQPGLFADFHNYRFKRAFSQLAVQWPAGLKALLDVEPILLTTWHDDYGQSLLQVAARWSFKDCTRRYSRTMCDNNCNCSESMALLLDRDCFLSGSDVQRILDAKTRPKISSLKAASALLQHLKEWRNKLQDTLYKFLPEKYQPATRGSALLDHEVPAAIANLEKIGVSPYKLYSLERGDYRLGPTPSVGVPQSTLFGYIVTAKVAQMAFDLGFRDVDVIFEGITPLGIHLYNLLKPDLSYCRWLICHGADFNRQIPQFDEQDILCVNVVNRSNRLLIHEAARWIGYELAYGSFPLEPMTDELSSWWFSLLGSSTYSDGCMCACSPSSRGCYPLTIIWNYYSLKSDKSNMWHWIPSVINDLTGGNIPLGLAESILQCLTFYRLEIRHTCCVFIEHHGYSHDGRDELEDLRAEDADRIDFLNHLVAEFMEQYRLEGVSLSSFIEGLWAERMDLIVAEEKRAKWSADERDAVISIGVIPLDEEDERESQSSIKSDDSLEAEYWIREIDIIAEGGRSKFSWLYDD
ncbi:hypothetical protein HD806DRAFT_536866 [Xylariaceae sp. AK1471]|nr:hypothetical protein HD806DRAFT_536866 [Xylariaceae sp. AK1471]